MLTMEMQKSDWVLQWVFRSLSDIQLYVWQELSVTRMFSAASQAVWEADALRRLKQRTDTTRIAKPVQAEAAISLGPYYFLHDQQILLFLLFLTKGILLSARFRGRCVWAWRERQQSSSSGSRQAYVVAQGTKFRFAKFCETWHSIRGYVDCITEPVARIRGCVQKLTHDLYFPETCSADRVFAEIYTIRSKQATISGILKKTESKNI